MLEETITIRHHCSKPPNLVAHMHLQLQAQPVVFRSHGVDQLQRKEVISGNSNMRLCASKKANAEPIDYRVDYPVHQLLQLESARDARALEAA